MSHSTPEIDLTKLYMFCESVKIYKYHAFFCRFGIEKEVRVCDSCHSQLQIGRTPREAPSSEGKRVTWADDQSWQDDQAAVMERYHKQKVIDKGP